LYLDNGEFAIVTELCNGDLRGRMSKDKARFKRVADTVTVLYRLALGLKAMHEQGVIHHDLKPENVFVSAALW
jgi:serine/threonine protein kinase